MDKNKTRIVVLSLFLLGALSFSAYSWVSAYRGDATVKGPNYSEDRHALMEKAFETNDYNLWKSQMEGKGLMNKINEGNFAKFAEAHRLANEGKNDEANKIRQELGLSGSGEGCSGCDSCNGTGAGTCSMEGKDSKAGSCGGGAGGCGMHKNK